MAFANLTAATYGCAATMYARWIAGTLKADLTAFAASVAPLFSDDNPNDRTVGNWLVIVQAIASQMTAGITADQSVIDASVQACFRLFNQASARQASGQISLAQANAVLAAANANLS